VKKVAIFFVPVMIGLPEVTDCEFPAKSRWSGSQRCVSVPNNWLPFLDTYRTMCLAPQPDFKRVLEDVRAMQLAA
jgi:hypothetical protein